MALTETSALAKDQRTGWYAAPQLQHRHFAFIAAVIARMPGNEARLEAATAFAGALARTNPNFDRERFTRACGLEV